ncbi:response regulator transcription factor [Streptomyces camelliae]|uniref:Helix-turn-helix transcriptional regulator n=1 Tax=Streptomyces camelliae TaxID=3004093 RepID=A0ABY7PHG8_9ACTN|nr:helix-turn-helix transcriptional regulator [Streptomyces sp. HUAS 2-6]WBO68351.1 helix-turn-helix transcriptional regulator [Streptomyces sp. HUAS 2-6]
MSATLVAPHSEAPASAAATAPQPSLAPRERETLRHIAAGRTYLQTARHMGLSTHTVDAYLRRIRAKFNITNTAELTRAAIALGL